MHSSETRSWPEAAALGLSLADAVGALAAQALEREVALTPKPGLVDGRNSGAHRDMDSSTFRASIAAIGPFLPRFVALGERLARRSAGAALAAARPLGLACERAMLAATGGVNTHKGGIFAFGLLCVAAGRLHGRGLRLSQQGLCAETAAMCAGLAVRELAGGGEARSAGERQFRQYGLTGARGEAESGFATVRTHALPAYQALTKLGASDEEALLQSLLLLLAHNRDSNLVARGGLAGLRYVQDAARARLAAGGARGEAGRAWLRALDDDLIARHLSPGGSADLLAVCWFLARFPER